jgi:hypothetical protein
VGRQAEREAGGDEAVELGVLLSGCEVDLGGEGRLAGRVGRRVGDGGLFMHGYQIDR